MIFSLIKVNIANGLGTESKLLIPIELKQWVNEWIFLGLSLDYASGSLFVYVKSFSSLGNEMKSLERLSFGDFKLKNQYEIVLGGIEQKNFQNFKGALYDWNLSTFYLGTVTEFVYLLTGKSALFDSGGMLFWTDFSISNSKFVTNGFYRTHIFNSNELQNKIDNGITINENQRRRSNRIKNTNTSLKKNTYKSRILERIIKNQKKKSKPLYFQKSKSRSLSSKNYLQYTKEKKRFFSSFSKQEFPLIVNKTIPFTNSEEFLKEKVFGSRFSFKDSMTLTNLLLGTNNIPQIQTITPGVEKPLNSSSSFFVKKFMLYLNFSFKEIVGDELIIFSSENPFSENGFYVSLVEKAKEDFYKQFLSDGVQVMPANHTFQNEYTYDSSQNKPKVLKLHVTAGNGKKLTFISPIQITPERQYRVTIGFFSYPPDIIRAFFQFENRFIFTHEAGDLDFTFSDQQVNLKNCVIFSTEFLRAIASRLADSSL